MKNILTLFIVAVSFFATKTAADEVDFTVTPILDGNQTVINQIISAKYHEQQSLGFNLQNNTDDTININIKTAIPDLDSKGNQIFSDCNTFLKAPQTITLPQEIVKMLLLIINPKLSKKILMVRLQMQFFFAKEIKVLNTS